MNQIQTVKGWNSIPFEDHVFFQEGPGLRTHQFTTSGMKVVNVTNLVGKYLDLDTTNRYISLEEFNKKYSHFAVDENDILMASSGATYGKVSWVQKKDLPLMMNTSVIRLHPRSGKLLKEFLWYFLKSPFFKNQIDKMITGSAQPNFGPTHLKKIQMAIPDDINTQRKIVQKLDYILGQLEEKKKEIFGLQKKISTSNLVRQYRLSILDMAYHGRLTKEWRVENPKIKSAQEFINNLMKQDEISNYIIKNYNLPPNWICCKLELLSELITKGSSPNWQGINYTDKGILFITSENIGIGNLKLNNKKHVEEKFNEKQKRSILQKNDLLTNIVGASIGRSAIFDIDENANINQAVSLIRLKRGVNPTYILNILNSPQTLFFMHGNKVDAARPNLSLKGVSNIPIPFPPIEEQNQIIKIISEKIDNSKNIELSLNYASETRNQIKTYLEYLINKILEQAFSGKLVN